MAEERISKVEGNLKEMIWNEVQSPKGEKIQKKRVRDIADTMKFTPHFPGIPKEEVKENKEEVIFEEMMAQNF